MDEPKGADDEQLVSGFDLRALTPEFLADPYPTYRALRRLSPLHELPDGGLFLTRYADCEAVYRARATSSDKRQMFKPTLGEGPIFEHHTTSLVFNDPPYHTRVRHAVQGALIARVLKSMEAPLSALVERLLDAGQARGSFDLIEDFAAAIPIEVIGNLLRIPLADRGPLRAWSLSILGALESRVSPEVLHQANEAVDGFSTYLRGLVAQRRNELLLDGTDALSLLIAAPGQAPLSEKELVHNAIFLLNAGHETTTNLIGNGVAALLEAPHVHACLRGQPDLIGSAVEEFLRYESSNQLGNRVLTAPLELNGRTVQAGTPLTLCIGAANRDPRQFDNPDTLDIKRRPNRHLAFGMGIHACAGMALARMEARIAVGQLVQRFENLTPDGEIARSGRARFRGFLRYRVRIG
ncbi:MAG: cytochrome P450 [Gammaproteobacteria bacterium]|jgi:cytochrome P450